MRLVSAAELDAWSSPAAMIVTPDHKYVVVSVGHLKKIGWTNDTIDTLADLASDAESSRPNLCNQNAWNA